MELEERIYSLVINEEKQEEIIALASIFEGDLEIVNADKATLNNNETIINIQMHPSEGGVKLSDQELRVTLTLEIIYGVETKLSIRNCKGLSNKRICEIESIVEKMQNQDEETIFDIIDIVKEKIDEMNQLPDGECPICLFPFERTNLYKVKIIILNKRSPKTDGNGKTAQTSMKLSN